MTKTAKNIQIKLPDQQFYQLDEISRNQGKTIEIFIQQLIEKECLKNTSKGLQAVEEMRELNLPVADWEQMEKESTEGCSIDE